jgi:hypothetical protein
MATGIYQYIVRDSCLCQEIHTKPVVDPDVWDEVPDKHVVESVCLAKDGQDGDTNGETKVAQENEFSILGFVQRAGRIEVIYTGEVTIDFPLATPFGLTLVVIVTCHVG